MPPEDIIQISLWSIPLSNGESFDRVEKWPVSSSYSLEISTIPISLVSSLNLDPLTKLSVLFTFLKLCFDDSRVNMKTLKIKSWKKMPVMFSCSTFMLSCVQGREIRAGMLFVKNKGKGRRQPLMFNRWFLSSKTLSSS